MQFWRDLGKEGYRKEGNQERRNAEEETLRKGGIQPQERRNELNEDTGKEECRKGKGRK